MDNTKITPVLDLDFLQKKANEYAMKGAEDAIKEFYNSYNSPYKKAIEENLKNKGVDHSFDIPDIIAVLNEKLSSEVDMIANTAISKTFIPLVKSFLTREDSEVKFSDILKTFIKVADFDHDEDDFYDYRTEKVSRHSDSPSLRDTFFSYQITNGKIGYELSFYKNKEITTIMSLPYTMNENGRYHGTSGVKQTMKLSLDGGATLELPFIKGVLEDDFVRFCARLVIGNNNIVFDCDEFHESMFPEREECHC